MAPKMASIFDFAKKKPVEKKRKLENEDVPTSPKPSKVAKIDIENVPTSPKPSKVAKIDDDLTGFVGELVRSVTCPVWGGLLKKDFHSELFQKICHTLEADYAKGRQVFPPRSQIFAAFNHARWDDLKVVIIGQDPYHGVGQAHGLCFSVNHGIKPPPSLVNMYTELEADIPGFKRPMHGNLEAWARQGVLLLNASLTVLAHEANSHAKIGWQTFTDNVIKLINQKHDGVVFLLWGGFAHKKGKLVDKRKHRVLEAAHPSPLSVTKWRGCKAFSKCNAALVELGKTPIDWKN